MYISYITKHLKLLSIEHFVFISIIFFIILTPNNYYFSLDKKRIFEVAIIYINLIILFNREFRCSLIKTFYIFSLTTRMLLFLLLILAIVSSIYAPLSRSAFLEISVLLGLFLISMTIFCLCLKNRNLFNNVFVPALIVSSIMYQSNFFSLYLYFMIHKNSIQWPMPFTGFANVRIFNQYQVWLFFLISYPLLSFKEMDFRISGGLKIMSIGWAILLFYSASRGAVIAIFSGLLISGFIFKQQAIKFIKLNLGFLCYGVIGSWFLFKLLPLVLSTEITSGWRTIDDLVTDNPRLYLWMRALNYIWTHPWLGIGPMHFAYYPNPISSYDTALAFGSPHNSVLQWASEMGIPSVLIVLGLMAWGLVLWIKRFKETFQKDTTVSKESSLWIILFTTLCSAFIYSLVDGVISPTSQLLMATVLGWMFGLYFQSNQKNIEIKNNLLILVFAGMLLVTLTYAIIPGLIPRLAGEENPSTREHPKLKYPRFWLQGHIPD